MSKNRDYTKYSNNKTEEKIEPAVEEVVETPVEEVVEPVVEEVVEEVVETSKPVMNGVVVDRVRLNVRSAPDSRASVICVINPSTKLAIDKEASTAEFYKVCTESGAEGYCMKRFVKLIP